MTENPYPPAPEVTLDDLYQLMAANYVMLQRIYDVQISLLQVREPEDAKRVHDLHVANQTLAPDIRLG
jgi:hypothetical protein